MFLQDQKAQGSEQLVIAHQDQGFAGQTSRCFRKLGWKVYATDTAAEARRLARILNPVMVILDTELPDESGWLMCDKLTRELPGLKVFLVSNRRSPWQSRFSDFVGATGLLWRYGSLRMLAEEIDGDILTATT